MPITFTCQQTQFSAGQLSRRARRRGEDQNALLGASELTNMEVEQDGTLGRRRGTVLIRAGKDYPVHMITQEDGYLGAYPVDYVVADKHSYIVHDGTSIIEEEDFQDEPPIQAQVDKDQTKYFGAVISGVPVVAGPTQSNGIDVSSITPPVYPSTIVCGPFGEFQDATLTFSSTVAAGDTGTVTSSNPIFDHDAANNIADIGFIWCRVGSDWGLFYYQSSSSTEASYTVEITIPGTPVTDFKKTLWVRYFDGTAGVIVSPDGGDYINACCRAGGRLAVGGGTTEYSRETVWLSGISAPGEDKLELTNQAYALRPISFFINNQDSTVSSTNAIDVSVGSPVVSLHPYQGGVFIGTTEGAKALLPIDGILSPTSFDLVNISNVGARGCPAATVSGILYYITSDEKTIMAVAPGQGGFQSGVASAHFSDLIGSGLLKLAAGGPGSTKLYALSADGYVLEIETAFGTLSASKLAVAGTDAEVDNIHCANNMLYLSVKRTIDGNTYRTLEVYQGEIGAADSLAAQYCLDACVTYSGHSSATLTGLDHLEGEAVTVVIDGGVDDEGPYTVSSGEVTLAETPSSADIVVGLPYTSRFESVDLFDSIRRNTYAGIPKTGKQGVVMLTDAWGGRVGWKSYDMYGKTQEELSDIQYPIREDTDPPELSDVDIDVGASAPKAREAHMVVTNDTPFAMGIIGYTTNVEVAE